MLVASVGCGAGGPVTAKVTGTVTYKSKPVAGRIVFFDEKGQSEFADLGADGTYTIMARLGKNTVAVHSREPDIPNPGKGPPMTLQGKSRIPEKYESHMRSGLTAEVKPGGNTANFDLND